MARKKKTTTELLSPGTIANLLRELKTPVDPPPIVVGGAPEQAAALRRELIEGGDPTAVRTGSPRGGAALVYVLSGPPGKPEERELREAHRATVPIVAVTPDPETPIPYVLATDAVHPADGAGLADVLARVLSDDGAALAGRLPFLRDAVCKRFVESFARKNALIGAAIFVPGADMPIMTLNQMRLVRRLAHAHGFGPAPERLAELAGVYGSALGLRYVGRSLLGFVPVAGFAIRAGVGYAGTRAVGEAAVKYYSAKGEDRAVRQGT